MKKIKQTFIALALLLMTVSNSYSSEKTSGNEINRGFLTNIRELKEISDVMDIVLENHVPTKEDLKSKSSDKKNTQENDEVKNKPIDKRVLLHGALKGIVDSLNDPYSSYFTKETMQEFNEDVKGKYPGVGMIIQKKPEDALIVVSPIEDTPAYKAGIKPKDKILTIDGKSTMPLTSDQCAKMLKGEPGTKVKITVYRESLKETKEVELTREIIKLNYVKSKMLENNIGYLRLTQFGEDVSPELAKELENLKKQNMKALIFDLRSNPGGSLSEAVKVASMFIKEGRIVSTKTKDGDEDVSNREGKYYGEFPLVILINAGSASASEIVAGAIKDYKRGILVGEKSFGKGSVQTIIQLPDGDGIKLTIAKYYTPNNISINGIGIEPDVKVEEKENYLLFDGTITNIDEKAQKENREELIKEVKGEKLAKKYETKVDVQLEKAMEILSKKLNLPYTPKEDKPVEEGKDISSESSSSSTEIKK